MLLFRSEEHVRAWCREHSVEPGATMTPEQAWLLATAWYTDRLDPGWRRRTAAEAQTVFESIGLTGPFWRF